MTDLPIPVSDWVLEGATPIGPTEHPLRELIADLLDEMDEGHRRALEMWAWEGLTFAEIAKELGLAGRQSGHERVQAALRALRNKLEELGYEARTGQFDSSRGGQRELRGPEARHGQLHSDDLHARRAVRQEPDGEDSGGGGRRAA